MENARTRLLVVDDVAENRDILARRFARQGFQVAEAEDGSTALDMICRDTFDAVLLDIVMPDLDGIEVLKRIRTNASPASLPVIMVTAKSEATDVVEALQLGANDYITKPVDFRVALARVQTQLARKQADEALRQANQDLGQRVRTLKASHEVAEQARAQAETASRAKTQFLTAMSHDIRVPLNSILGYAELVLEEAPLAEEHRSYVQRIGIAGSALLTIVNDVLDFTKIETGEVALKNETFSLHRLLADTVALIKPMADNQGLPIRIDHDGIPERVAGDPDRLLQVLLNLLNNVVKFTREGGIEVKVRCLSEDDLGCLVRFSVVGAGIGIPEDKQAHLFQSFIRADGSSGRTHGGIGLGLPLSHRLVQLMGGRIGFQGDPDRGSTVWFEVPLRRSHEISSPAQEGADAAAFRIAIVEGDETNQDRARASVKPPGQDVKVVSNRDEAIRSLQATHDRDDVPEIPSEGAGESGLASRYAELVKERQDLLARAFELEREVQRRIPPIPDVLLARPADADLDLPAPLRHADGRRWFGYEQVEILRGRLRLSPGRVPEPDLNARMDEIIEGWDQWRDDVEWLRRSVGLSALNREIERNADAQRDLLARIALMAVGQVI